ncbi:hypothetical protein BB559_002606 [Furculomyces boomerangus]|uniref:ER-derived vesicles protein ERV14 n=2 Tax=Harpellales TaxID=61421 RepID=A0A2T9YTY8_9FUNG|nr:hypothetical protein BB559_002606 [Furculomyces boomerangus]PVZ98324.1 hypothetical protein BB558_005666 [Smittium angustum]
MSYTSLVYILALIISAVLLFGAVYFVIMLTDLECDYINPIDLANSLNTYVMPEFILFSVMLLMFLFVGQWFTFVLNLPLFLWNVSKISSNRQFYDATEVFRTLPRHKRENFTKVGFFLLSFFYYLYCMIVTLINEPADTLISS